MRALAMLAVLCALPSSALAQDEEFDRAERFLGDAPTRAQWNLDDASGVEDVPWDNYDAATSYLPRSLFHGGLELRAGVIPTVHSATEIRPQVELHGFLDWRYGARSPWHIRIGLALSYEPSRSVNFGGGTLVTTSTVGLRLRILPISVDLGRYIGLRAGPDVGIQIAPGPAGARLMVAAGGIAQLVARPFDGRMEIGLYVGGQLTGISRLERPNTRFDRPTGGESYLVDATFGLSAGYLF